MYSVFLDGWQFPVTPSKLNVAIKGKNKTLTLVNDGEINFLKTPGLTEIESFDASFPMLAAYPFAVYPNGFKPPDYFLGKLESLMTNKKPAQFIVSRISPAGKLLFSTNMQVSVESYTIKESATDGLDVTVSIKLKQYKSFSTKTVTLPPVVTTPAPTTTTTAAKPTTTKKRSRSATSLILPVRNTIPAQPAIQVIPASPARQRSRKSQAAQNTLIISCVFQVKAPLCTAG